MRITRTIFIALAAAGFIGGTTLPVVAASAAPSAAHVHHVVADGPDVYYHA